jgi:hypothetical protein
MSRILTIIIIIGLIAATACKKIEPADPVPEIGFKEFRIEDGYDSIGNETKNCELLFSFIDGDGDIGLIKNEFDTIDPKNVFIIPFNKSEDNYYREDDLDTLTFWIQHDDKMERVGQNKTLKGEIKVKFNYYVQFISDYDTLKFDFYIIDKAGHQSNVESTNDIAFN